MSTPTVCKLCAIRPASLHKNRKIETYTKYCAECRTRLAEQGMTNEEKQRWLIRKEETRTDNLHELDLCCKYIDLHFKSNQRKLHTLYRRMTARTSKHDSQTTDTTLEWIHTTRKTNDATLKTALEQLRVSLETIKYSLRDCPVPGINVPDTETTNA